MEFHIRLMSSLPAGFTWTAAAVAAERQQVGALVCLPSTFICLQVVAEFVRTCIDSEYDQVRAIQETIGHVLVIICLSSST